MLLMPGFVCATMAVDLWELPAAARRALKPSRPPSRTFPYLAAIPFAALKPRPARVCGSHPHPTTIAARRLSTHGLLHGPVGVPDTQNAPAHASANRVILKSDDGVSRPSNLI
jgi:hypothetical protein